MLTVRRRCIGLVLVMGAVASGQSGKAPVSPETRKLAGQSIDRSIQYLRSIQNADGSFGEAELAPSLTGIIMAGIIQTNRLSLSDPIIQRGLARLEKYVQPDGGIYVDAHSKNYPTAIALMAFAAANKDKRYQALIDKTVAFLKTEQWDQGRGIGADDLKYGGVGYGKHQRPDLSNTAMWMEALRQAGLPKDDPAYQRALLFVTRCQNLTGEGASDQAVAGLVNDGGFMYTPNESQAGGSVEQGLRSYASMTYAGLKSFIYAGVDPQDRRVQAALAWLKKNYSLADNPGLDQQGLFYYYHTMAKALAVAGEDQFVDAAGKSHQWREDLIKTIVDKQRPDGSWINPQPRWLESEPRLVTAYSLLALSHALKETP